MTVTPLKDIVAIDQSQQERPFVYSWQQTIGTGNGFTVPLRCVLLQRDISETFYDEWKVFGKGFHRCSLWLYRGNGILEILYSRLKKNYFTGSRIWVDERSISFRAELNFCPEIFAGKPDADQ